MHSHNWIKLGVVMGLFAIGAFADGGDKDNGGSLQASIVGSTPGVTVGGVMSGGAPWVIERGEVSVSGSGKLKLKVRGLLLGTGAPSNLVGTTGPVQMVAASLVCGGSGGAVAASTEGVPLSTMGDAEIKADITVPATCTASVVLIRAFNRTAAAGSQLGSFIALTGFNMSTNPSKGDDNQDQ